LVEAELRLLSGARPLSSARGAFAPLEPDGSGVGNGAEAKALAATDADARAAGETAPRASYPAEFLGRSGAKFYFALAPPPPAPFWRAGAWLFTPTPAPAPTAPKPSAFPNSALILNRAQGFLLPPGDSAAALGPVSPLPSLASLDSLPRGLILVSAPPEARADALTLTLSLIPQGETLLVSAESPLFLESVALRFSPDDPRVLYPYLDGPPRLTPFSLLTIRARERAETEKALAALRAGEASLAGRRERVGARLAALQAVASLEKDLASLKEEISGREGEWDRVERRHAKALAAWEKAPKPQTAAGLLSSLLAFAQRTGQRAARLETLERALNEAEKAMKSARRAKESFLAEAKALKDSLREKRARLPALESPGDAARELAREIEALETEIARHKKRAGALAALLRPPLDRPLSFSDLATRPITLANSLWRESPTLPAGSQWDNIVAVAPSTLDGAGRAETLGALARARQRLVLIADLSLLSLGKAPLDEEGVPAWRVYEGLRADPPASVPPTPEAAPEAAVGATRGESGASVADSHPAPGEETVPAKAAGARASGDLPASAEAPGKARTPEQAEAPENTEASAITETPAPPAPRPRGGGLPAPLPPDPFGFLAETRARAARGPHPLPLGLRDGLALSPLPESSGIAWRARGETGPLNPLSALSALKIAVQYLGGHNEDYFFPKIRGEASLGAPAAPLSPGAPDAEKSPARAAYILSPSPSQAFLTRTLARDLGPGRLRLSVGEIADFENWPPAPLLILDSGLSPPHASSALAKGPRALQSLRRALSLASSALVVVGDPETLRDLPADGPLGSLARAARETLRVDLRRSFFPPEKPFAEALESAERNVFAVLPPMDPAWWPALAPRLEAAPRRGVKVTIIAAVPDPSAREYPGKAIRDLKIAGAQVILGRGFPGLLALVDETRFFIGPALSAPDPFASLYGARLPEAGPWLAETLQAPLLARKLGPGAPRSCPLCGWPILLVNQARPKGFGDLNSLKLGCLNPSCAASREPRPLDERWPFAQAPRCARDPELKYEIVKKGKKAFWACPKHPDGDCPRYRVIPGDPAPQ
jgi:hypothetical protein